MTAPGEPAVPGPEAGPAGPVQPAEWGGPDVPDRNARVAPRPRRQRKAASRTFRSNRTVPATIVALVVLAAAIVTLVGAVAAAVRARATMPALSWLAPLGRARWDDPATLATSAASLLLGLVLLTTALKPGRARLIPLASDDPQTVTGITRSGLRRHLAAVAAAVNGVSRAHVRLRRRGAAVTVATPLRDPGELSGQVGQAVEEHLAELRPLRPMRVKVAVRRKGE
ncbi:DUF6286 domain-containing protein [Sphaerisporangium melleum]|nr:DUF6286 domain-containing protein [Sphaerisporangium melleum]